jgi:hypothetical protein
MTCLYRLKATWAETSQAEYLSFYKFIISGAFYNDGKLLLYSTGPGTVWEDSTQGCGNEKMGPLEAILERGLLEAILETGLIIGSHLRDRIVGGHLEGGTIGGHFRGAVDGSHFGGWLLQVVKKTHRWGLYLLCEITLY